MNDPGSLDRLRDIVEPARVSFWPPAPGWWVVLGGLLMLAVWISCRWWMKHQANRYRRQALRQLASARSVAEVNRVLKRTALTAYARCDVASLSGSDWLAWLHDSSRVPVTDRVARIMSEEPYRKDDVPCPVELMQFAEAWIRQHTTPEPLSVSA